MKESSDYISINKATWNNKTDVHIASEFYDVEGFLKGKSTLNDIELSLLGDVTGKKILHLQCHFGQDTMSLARMGAKVTGLDLSDKAIERAREFAQKLNLDASFVCCDIYEAPNFINEKFDLVFTSYGTIGWLPDLGKWANVISHFLKPNGKFIMADFHPVVWMYDNDFKEVFYSYFNIEPIIEEETGTYADTEAELHSKTVGWNHPISEILNSLLQSGLELNQFNEYDYSPYNCFNQTEEFEKGKFRIKHFENKIPMVYSILATKK
ncbi:class I SAM-dependent methyltransferase [Flavobacterium sp. J49]|uniref:class I SAM-dependent methyltransferase n=1 Tax=Flavobacterium sp. J49 TaxID=2718534 RepID=UPI001592BCA4|nr:class I SAM-dependent methyltransferase [Flavobacterium sp. J49]MBF6640987.1 class I SAM-dependent methyltransferase [Flavobacterium sp. J49]NIC02234.1 class I SAM-dependent methyltransferase [Flavobacterium sp. J49]